MNSKWGSGELLLIFKIDEVQAFYANKLVTKKERTKEIMELERIGNIG